MGIDWETILDAEGAGLADAYEDMVFDAMEQMDKGRWDQEEQGGYGAGRCVPFPAGQGAGASPGEGPGVEGFDVGPQEMWPELELSMDIYLGSTAKLNAINERIFNLLLSIQGFIVDSGAVGDAGGFWKRARDMCAAASFPLELAYGAERSAAENRLCRYRHARQSVQCAAAATRFTDWAAPGRSMAALWAKLDELDEEIKQYDAELNGLGQ